MGKTKIEWTEYSWNPLRGVAGNWHCTKVSPGCANCYAESVNHRFGGPPYYVGADLIRLDMKVLQQPTRWRTPRMVFTCSMTDLFHESLDFSDIAEVFRHMRPQHTFQVLTKRPERVLEFLEWIRGCSSGLPGPVLSWPLPNVWLGVSCENQEMADRRIPQLLQIPATVRWLSLEPLLGPIDLRPYIGAECVDGRLWGVEDGWVVVGGESGPRARPMHPDWVRSLRDQCNLPRVNLPFFFKQWGEWRPELPVNDLVSGYRPAPPKEQWLNHDGGQGYHGEHVWLMKRMGKKAAGRVLDGCTWNMMPAVRP